MAGRCICAADLSVHPLENGPCPGQAHPFRRPRVQTSSGRSMRLFCCYAVRPFRRKRQIERPAPAPCLMPREHLNAEPEHARLLRPAGRLWRCGPQLSCFTLRKPGLRTTAKCPDRRLRPFCRFVVMGSFGASPGISLPLPSLVRPQAPQAPVMLTAGLAGSAADTARPVRFFASSPLRT